MGGFLDLAISVCYLPKRFETLLLAWVQKGNESRMDVVVGWKKRRGVACEDKEHFCNHQRLVTSTATRAGCINVSSAHRVVGRGRRAGRCARCGGRCRTCGVTRVTRRADKRASESSPGTDAHRSKHSFNMDTRLRRVLAKQ